MSSYQLKDIVYEAPAHWVLKVPYGFDVYKVGATHSTRCARIGFKGEVGLEKARQEIARRQRTNN